MEKDQVAGIGSGETRDLIDTAGGLAASTARWVFKIAAMPVLPLPPFFREGFFGTARLTLETLNTLPAAASRTLTAVVEELDELEGRSARREDLGSRLRREERRRQRQDS